MRKITPLPIIQFSTLVSAEAAVAAVIGYYGTIPLIGTDFRGIAAVAGGIAAFYLLAIGAFRAIQAAAPVPIGPIAAGSRDEGRAFLYILHYLMLFNPLIFSRTMPVPLMRLVLGALGARMGRNSYSSGIMMDPQFVSVGDDTIIGNSAMIIPHVIEGSDLGFYRVRLGSRVTIGARAVIMADVSIGDDAIVAIQSVVTKGTVIGPGEVWGGTPARCLRKPQ